MFAIRCAPCALLLLSLLTVAVQAADTAPNRVLRLDGAGDYVQLPSGIFDDLEQATIEAWVKWDDFSWYEPWISYGLKANRQILEINHEWRFLRPQLIIFNRDQGSHWARTDANLSPGQWLHMAGVTGPGGMRLYINGIEVGRDEFTGSFAALGGHSVKDTRDEYTGSFAAAGSGNEFYLGHSSSNNYPDFMGELDEVRIWRTRRTAEQIRANLYRRLRGDEPGLAALWNFDEACAEGTTARDASGHGHHGRLVGQAHCPEVTLPDRLEEPMVLQGRMLGDSGDPESFVAGYLHKNGTQVARTYGDASGTYRFHVFGPGRYDLSTYRDDQGTWREGLDLAPGQAHSVDLVLRRAISLQGRVVHRDGTPQRGVLVQALASDGRVAQWVQTDAEGDFRFINLQPGAYAVRVHLPDRYVYATAEGGTANAAASTFLVESGRTATVPPVRLAPFRRGTWRVYDAFDGLKANAITDLASTVDGTLWLATKGSGAWSFDGQTFSNLTTTDGLVHDEVNGVTVTADGALWFATQGGATRYKDGQLTSLTAADGLAHDQVNAVYETPDGALWFATHRGVSRLVADGFESIAAVDSALTGTIIIDVHQDRTGALWLATDPLGLWRYADGEMTMFSMRQGLGYIRVWSLLETRDGTMWFATQQGISRYEGGGAFTSFFSFGNEEFMDIRFVEAYQSRDGALWFATQDRGVLRSDGEHFTTFTVAEGLAHNSVSAIHEDFQGGLWFGSADGSLTRYDAHSIDNLGAADGLGAGRVNALIEAPEGGLWLGTNRGVRRLSDDVFTSLDLEQGLASQVSSLALVDGELWIGTFEAGGRILHNGIWRYDGSAPRQINIDRNLAAYEEMIHDLYVGADGLVWAASRGGAMYIEGDDYELLTERDGLPVPDVRAVGADADGLLYFGTHGGGLAVYDGQQLSILTTADGLANDRVTALRTDPDGALWIGTHGGVSRYDGSAFTTYTPGDGLPHGRIEDIAVDASGRRWLATHGAGLAAFDGTYWSAIDTRDGLGDNRINALLVNDDGSLWLGTENGLTRYVPDATPPNVRVVSAQADSLYRAPTALAAFTTDTRAVIDYRAIDFKTHPDKRQYRYRVVGLDADWRPPTTEDRFEWTPDEAGDYTFEVQAIDRDLNYSASARLALRVVPAWYDNAWIVGPAGGGVVLLFVVAVISSARFYHSRREAQALREQLLTRERTARETAEAAAQKAEAANRAKSAFLANMSHELRTPLNAILGFSQLLQQSGEVGAGQRDNVQIISRSGEHLLALINDVLEMSRIEAGRTELEETVFDLPQLIDSLIDMFRLRVEDKGLQLTCERSEELPTYIRADEGKLRQILINLLGNAVKFTETGGVAFKGDWVQERLCVAVEDTGPGIAPEEQDTLFEAFVQTQSGRQARTGTGLGLAISQQFAQLMGGAISVESEVGVGSAFRLDLPVTVAAAAELPQAEDRRRVVGLAEGQPEWRVLVVDDGEHNRLLLRQLLEPAGFAVREADNGREAVAIWQSWQPQLIWMDMRMPLMDGYEATRQIRARGAGATKIIALTASAFEENRQQVLDAGCDDFVRKPFRTEELFAKIAEHLGAVYVYDEEPAPTLAAVALRVEDLAVLPAEWRRSLAEAANLGDDDTILALIAQIESEHADLAQRLRKMVEDFAFAELVHLGAE